jgi:maltooligosyltrehalose trehalohydrolase
MRLGANYIGNGECEFVVWGPLLKAVTVQLFPSKKLLSMSRDECGYWKATAKNVHDGGRYLFHLSDSLARPDPASAFQPNGVHGQSEIVDHKSFTWTDGEWKGVPLERMVIYEIHVGTFTPEGTFDAIILRLDDLAATGINAIELMPIAQFPGDRNWGYDGVYPFAVQNSYGGPQGLKRLVDACHCKGFAVILDVVYNHLGPEGNYLAEFAPYFTDKYKTPWGKAINFDGPYSDGVKTYFVENALNWLENYHIDALRLDAVHAIFDMGACHFLEELSEEVRQLAARTGKKLFLIAESNLNDSRLIRPGEIGGYGLDAQWCDDLHHSMRALLIEETSGYYIDFGKTEQFVKSLREGFVFTGQYSKYRKRRHGRSAIDRAANQFIVFAQNHDQVGNRMNGERLSHLVEFEALKLAAATVLLSPYVPLLFMGEDYAEASPFLYFVSHSDPQLVDSVRQGRRAEFERFMWTGEPPDPQDEQTFLKSKLNWEQRRVGHHASLLAFYRRLIQLRSVIPSLANLDRSFVDVREVPGRKAVVMRRGGGQDRTFCIFNFEKSFVNVDMGSTAGLWSRIIDSAEEEWGGSGSMLPKRVESPRELSVSPLSAVLFELSL